MKDEKSRTSALDSLRGAAHAHALARASAGPFYARGLDSPIDDARPSLRPPCVIKAFFKGALCCALALSFAGCETPSAPRPARQQSASAPASPCDVYGRKRGTQDYASEVLFSTDAEGEDHEAIERKWVELKRKEYAEDGPGTYLETSPHTDNEYKFVVNEPAAPIVEEAPAQEQPVYYAPDATYAPSFTAPPQSYRQSSDVSAPGIR
jgi:hypothetical protein